jgi:hypothetical protein
MTFAVLPAIALNLALSAPASFGQAAKVVVSRVPNGGIQPQAVVDAAQTVHLIYFKGEPKGGDIYYLRQSQGGDKFSEPLRVNSQPGSAIAVGTIRGAQLALGRNGRLHVAWNGSKSVNAHPGAPMLCTRLNDKGDAFEPERDLMTRTLHLDGGGSVAADDQGNVYVVWHAAESGEPEGEGNRKVFVARSQDDGKRFARETVGNPQPTGACGCCGLRAFADAPGNLFVLYRTAMQTTNRDEVLLVSRNHGASFEIANRHPWNVAACPMSSASLTESKAGVLAAWETAGQVYFSRVAPDTLKVSLPASPPGGAARKHPVAVGNDRGEVLLVWAEGTGWQRGGSLAWQLFEAKGKPTNDKGRAEGVPTWSFATAVARAGGDFLIIY